MEQITRGFTAAFTNHSHMSLLVESSGRCSLLCCVLSLPSADFKPCQCIQMLEEMDMMEGVGASPRVTPQPTTEWSRGAHSHAGHAHSGDPEHDADDSAEDEGTSYLVFFSPSICFQVCSFSALASSWPFFLSRPSVLLRSVCPFLAFPPVLLLFALVRLRMLSVSSQMI